MNDSNTARDFVIFVCLMAMIFSLSPFAIDMYLPALPTMAKYFNTSIDAMEASVAVYLLAFAVGQFVFGAIADSLDKTKLLMLGVLVFAISSFFIGHSRSEFSLFAWRSVQAFFAGSAVVVYAIIHQKYGSKQSSQIISYILSVVVIAPMIAPMIGSQILIYFSWNMIFYALGIYALITLVIQYFSAKSLPKSKTQSLHLKSMIKGYKKIFSNPITLSYIFAGGFSFSGLFAFISGSPYVYMEYFKVSPEQFGWLVALNAMAMICINLMNAKILGHIDPTKKLIIGGFLLFLVSVYLLSVGYLKMRLPFVATGVVMYVGILGLTAANAMAGALSSAKEYAGMVSGINGVMQFGLGAAASGIVSVSASTSAMTMSGMMGICGIFSFIFTLFLFRKKLSESGKVA